MWRRPALLLGLVMALSLVLVPTAAAHGSGHGGGNGNGSGSLPERIDLPAGFQPEGIAAGRRGALYVGSRTDGTILRIDPKRGTTETFVEGGAGMAALGLHIDWRGRLWVAGGPNKDVRVYSTRSGDLLASYAFPGAGFLNDLVITRKAVYVTDSRVQQLAVIPLGKRGRLPDADRASVVPLTGDMLYGEGFNANGIVARHGKLIVVQSNTGQLFRVDRKTGETVEIDIGDRTVENGDGLLIRGRYLWVVRNQDNVIDVYKLSRSMRSATYKGSITDSELLDTPSTGAFSRGTLWTVQARFTTDATPETVYWIARVPTWPSS